VGKSPEFEDNEIVQQQFGDFLRSMFTMVQLITMDTYCDDIIRPVAKEKPALAVFFVLFIAVGVFVVMNLVTAIIVDTAQNIVKQDTEQQAKEEENKKRRDLKLLSELFMEIDLDGSGELSRQEFFTSLKNEKVKRMLTVMDMKVGELEETWDVLDDGDGLLTIKEFTNGIRRMKGEAKAKDIADVVKQLRTTNKKHHDLKAQATRYSDTLSGLERDTAEMAKDCEMIVTLFKEMYHRLSGHVVQGEREDRNRRIETAKLEKLAGALALEEEKVETESEPEEDDGVE
jgi:hypothetical protein